MKSKNLSYTTIILLHIGLGILIYMASKLSIPYGLAILSVGLLTILKTQNTKNQVLYFCAYIVGSEVILRMTGGSLSYEIGKYSVILFMLMGIYFSGFSKNSFLYWIFLILLLPGVLLATVTLKLDTDIQKSIAFNISGPVCLGISALYCYQRKITLKELDNILFCMLCPIITTVTYMFLYTPSVKKIITSTQSNFETSGGFGPNQVSTIVGLGVFIMFSRLVFHSKNKQIIVLNTTLLLIMAFRGIITFSRGGMLSSAVMIALLLLILFFVTQRAAKIKLFWMVVFSFVAFLIIWSYSSSQTNGLIAKRYANEDASGRVKSTLLSGREEIIGSEFDMFLANPIFGIGVGKGRENRLESTGESIASHNEISRMLAEHGSLGALGIVILFVTPLVLYTNNRRHIYLLSFFAFWILTINHAAMRLAAPAFVYALSLLHIYSIEDQKKLNENIE
ncbi:O-antigen ligase family protein [Flavobacterium psychrophilum]|uniref:O-antigen ligase family protein n=1 Tax=Flavobacterium psychrophilum TaxID=96345 RepID=UPI000B7C523F|nr:O-antigen ligase family protein [Flavobacterium psychrophilum]EKT4498119.1 O-antigen ligase family protein [Flavobacterium psychrophilum]EKT4549496.1 O-antigen ligase family protein [Flavobacterium psychrophilum]ELM3649386.1 O-antigen ligase family protein [Flavobacterium psychrophilum]ELM3670232.1 O-antigen ligase family protein [Flavobacterium psychrophilum]ELM3724946.1 O-antigen ligase family protein [Flavobacterium psychrophilum]